MGVTIRKKKLKGNWVSLYLDIIFHGSRKNEFLGIKYNDKPANLSERQIKKDLDELAKRIALKREMEVIKGEYDIDAGNTQGMDFFTFFQDYIDKHKNLVDIRCYISTLHKLKSFVGNSKLPCRELNGSLLERFSKYLILKHHGETPYNYFKKLKRVIKEAVREKRLKENPSVDIKCSKQLGVEKAVLDFSEIRLLYQTECSNSDVKRAFLVSCLTGLRYCDVKELKWRNVKENIIDIVQKKTKSRVTIVLNDDALKLIGERKEATELIFRLPSHNGCLGVLSTWTKKAGIEKKITWHVGRHSFATNLIQLGTDILITSKLLGHTSLKYTTRYTRVNEGLKSDAVSKFPGIL